MPNTKCSYSFYKVSIKETFKKTKEPQIYCTPLDHSDPSCSDGTAPVAALRWAWVSVVRDFLNKGTVCDKQRALLGSISILPSICLGGENKGAKDQREILLHIHISGVKLEK